MGIATITDSLAAIKKHVYDDRELSLAALLRSLDGNFQEDEPLRLMLANRTPRYGNDDDYADAIMQQVFQSFLAAVEGRPNTKGGEYHIDMLPTTCHIYFGSITGALPDGRRAGMHLAEGIPPVQGARPARANRSDQVGGQDGSPSDGGNTAEPKVHAPGPSRPKRVSRS